MEREIEQLKQAMEVCELGALTLPDQIDALMDAARAILQEVSTLTQPNEPLTLKELRQMDGKPVWVEDVDHWALIDIEKGGEWDGVPFAIWTENGANFCYNVMDRNLLCYRRPPEREEEA